MKKLADDEPGWGRGLWRERHCGLVLHLKINISIHPSFQQAHKGFHSNLLFMCIVYASLHLWCWWTAAWHYVTWHLTANSVGHLRGKSQEGLEIFEHLRIHLCQGGDGRENKYLKSFSHTHFTICTDFYLFSHTQLPLSAQNRDWSSSSHMNNADT